MGGREVGGLATQLAAHRGLEDPAHRAEVARLWGVDALPSKPGLTAVELFDALAGGRVKAVWIACTNPAQSLPDLPRVRAALERAELVVLQEAYADTETAPFADVLLPATSWAEKEGTVTNSERRIARVRAAVPGPSEARHDWEIACDFGRRLEARMGRAGHTLLPWKSAEEVWNEHRELTRGRDLDITGLSYAMLDERGPQQWPFPQGAATGRARLYEDGRFETPDGRARFAAERYRPASEAVSARYPLRLTTVRLRDQWHAMTRTATVPGLFGHAPEPRLSMNGADLARRGLRSGDLVCVESARGGLYVIAQEDDEMRSGQACLPMHWGRRFLGGTGSCGANTVTSPALDPQSRQPELKHAVIRVIAAELPWRLVAFAEVGDEGVAPMLAALQPLQDEVAFWSLVPMGRDRAGILVRAAHRGKPDGGWVERLDAMLGLGADDVLCYDDARRGHSRRVRIAADRLLAVRLTGDEGAITSGEWLREWLVGGRPVADVRRLLLSPATHAPSGFVLSGRVVCQCHNVSEREILAALPGCEGDAGERVKRLGERMKCGTQCGSCLPELRALAEQVAPNAGRMVA
jgi:assimilatory nitrate reductase catalytic subunit